MVFHDGIRILDVTHHEFPHEFPSDQPADAGDLFENDALWRQTDRYLAGEATSEEQAAYEHWLARNPHAGVLVDDIQHALGAVLPARVENGPDIWNRARQNFTSGTIDTPMVERSRGLFPGRQHRTRQVHTRHIRGMAIAGGLAALAMVVGITAYSHLVVDGDAATRTFVTQPGERATINLGDGSKVMLGPVTTLSIPAAYGNGQRVLQVSGTAYFSVAQSTSSPFVVETDRARVRVLGTVFGVRAYADESDAVVAVEDGRVAVSEMASQDTTFDLVLSANGVAHVGRDGTAMVRRSQEVSSLLSWTRGRLVFTDTPVSNVLQELERWYGVTFHVTDPRIHGLLLTAVFDNQPPGDLAHALGSVLNVRAEQDGSMITLSWSHEE